MIINADPCPCSSGVEYSKCCRPLHRGKPAENALQLMRSRYSAYVLNLPDYIVATTHPASPQYLENKFSWKRHITQFSKKSTFHKLEIVDFKEKKDLATVTFTAFLSEGKEDATFTEVSYFEKKNNLWLYRRGKLTQGHAPNLVTTGQLRLLPLAYFGDPILTRNADPILEITSDIHKLVEEMIETMDACDGIGIAAPQVHHSIRLFVYRTPLLNKEGKLDAGEVNVVINPSISKLSEDTWKTSEACLSIPTIQAEVKRSKEISIEYTSLEGDKISKELSGWEARVFMHEFDHIEGILFIDRLDPEEKELLLPLLTNLERRIHDRRAL